MRLNSTLAGVAPIVLAFAASVHAQASGDDSAGARAIRQTGVLLSSAANDTLFRRAERLVREGRGDAGRALVDSLLAAARPGTAPHGQALYWRASLAGDAAEAERGYRRVIVDYPATAWAGDALLNLAQLEMARGSQEQALVHLHRFEREHPSHESRARASFWLARLHFERKQEARGCAVLATARGAASPEELELRNQIDYYSQRCIGVDTGAAVPSHAAGAVQVPTTPAPAPPVSTASTPPVPSTALSSPTARGSAGRPAAAVDTGARPQIEVGQYTVQVAAFDTRAAAERLIERLAARGYTARLATTARPFRVRIGRYDTRAQAIAALQRLKAKGIDGWVTEAERP